VRPGALFGISIVLGFVAWGLFAARYLWPALQARSRLEALQPILLLHSFRFIGLAFLVPGVVSADLPGGFAVPAGYGDLGAALLALLAIAALRSPIGIALVWAWNLWGSADLLHAYYQGRIGVGVEPGDLGAAYFIPTVVVPLLLVTHFLAFRLLLRRESPARAA
jgi:hypothetical protein